MDIYLCQSLRDELLENLFRRHRTAPSISLVVGNAVESMCTLDMKSLVDTIFGRPVTPFPYSIPSEGTRWGDGWVIYLQYQYHTILYHTKPNHPIPHHTVPYHTIPYHTTPYRTAPRHALPFRSTALQYLISISVVSSLPLLLRVVLRGPRIARVVHVFISVNFVVVLHVFRV